MSHERKLKYETSPNISKREVIEKSHIDTNIDIKNGGSNKKKLTVLTVFCGLLIVIPFLLMSIDELQDRRNQERMENVLEKRYNDKFEFVGVLDSSFNYTVYELKSENFPNEEIRLAIYYESNDFWDDKKWEDNYLNIKYREEAEMALNKLGKEAYGQETEIKINYLNTAVIPGAVAEKCQTFNDYMENVLMYSSIHILTNGSISEKDINTDSFIILLKTKGYLARRLTLYYFEDGTNYEHYEDVLNSAIHVESINIGNDYALVKN